MRFLANENFPGDTVEALRQQGNNVSWIRTDAPGSTDIDVLAFAQSEERIILTFDKDFGELAFHSGLPASSGVILFRLRMVFTSASHSNCCRCPIEPFRLGWALQCS